MVTSVESVQHFDKLISTPQLTVAHFSAEWVDQCKDVNNVLKELSADAEIAQHGVTFVECNAEQHSAISLKHGIEAVPSVLLFRSGALLDRVNGADAMQITKKVHAHKTGGKNAPPPISGAISNLEDRLKALINQHRVMVFMKGNREQPKCGFSKQLMQILTTSGVAYDTFDILQDEEVRQGLKTYSDWPTYPQLYVQGELIGGLDIIKELNASGELLQTLNG